MDPKISVVICVYNRVTFIEKCLSALRQQTSENFEIIIVDDASTDGTYQFLQAIADPRLKLVRNHKTQGPSFSRNEGIKYSLGEFIAFLDSDCVAKPSWVEAIVKPFVLDKKIMISSGKTLDPVSPNFWENFNKGTNYIALKDGLVSHAYTCNMAVRKDFIINNLFDESLPFSEDIDLCFRCVAQGFKIYYTQSAELFHYHRSSFSSTVLTLFRWSLYNAYVRLRANRPPYLNYGTYCLLGLPLSIMAGHLMGLKILFHLAILLLAVYLVLIFREGLHSNRWAKKETIIYYLIFLLFLPISIAGDLGGLCIYCKRKLSNQTDLRVH